MLMMTVQALRGGIFNQHVLVEIGLVAYFVVGLIRGHRNIVPLLAAFALFHLVDGLIIGFWTKAILQFAALCVLGFCPRGRYRHGA